MGWVPRPRPYLRPCISTTHLPLSRSLSRHKCTTTLNSLTLARTRTHWQSAAAADGTVTAMTAVIAVADGGDRDRWWYQQHERAWARGAGGWAGSRSRPSAAWERELTKLEMARPFSSSSFEIHLLGDRGGWKRHRLQWRSLARSTLQLKQIRTNATGARFGNRTTCETNGRAVEDAEERSPGRPRGSVTLSVTQWQGKPKVWMDHRSSETSFLWTVERPRQRDNIHLRTERTKPYCPFSSSGASSFCDRNATIGRRLTKEE